MKNDVQGASPSRQIAFALDATTLPMFLESVDKQDPSPGAYLIKELASHDLYKGDTEHTGLVAAIRRMLAIPSSLLDSSDRHIENQVLSAMPRMTKWIPAPRRSFLKASAGGFFMASVLSLHKSDQEEDTSKQLREQAFRIEDEAINNPQRAPEATHWHKKADAHKDASNDWQALSCGMNASGILFLAVDFIEANTGIENDIDFSQWNAFSEENKASLFAKLLVNELNDLIRQRAHMQQQGRGSGL